MASAIGTMRGVHGAVILSLLVHCSEDAPPVWLGGSGPPPAGGAVAGGAPLGGAGGRVPSGGGTPSEGAGGSGGVTGSGGVIASGGVTGSGGVIASGGVTGSGGAPTGGAGSMDDAGMPPPVDAAMDAGPPEDAGTPVDTGMPDPPPTGPFPPVADLEAPGPYAPVTVNNTGPNGQYTLYHPRELAPDGRTHPMLTWGNGILTTPSWYTLLPHLASHGFVVIASNSAAVTGEDLIGGLDWLMAEQERMGGLLYQALDTAQVASVGYSLGSVATFDIAADPRLTTTVHISGGSFDKAVVANLHAPTAFFCGDPGGDGLFVGDAARANCDSDFDVVTVPAVYGTFDGGSHLGVITSPYMERIRAAVTGWVRWRLMADQTLESMFLGDSCELCSDPSWTVQQKNWK